MKAKEDALEQNTEAERDEESSKGWEVDAPTANEALREETRSLDIGGSGQFAPGGYFNQRETTRPRRIDLDDYVVPPARDSRDSKRDKE